MSKIRWEGYFKAQDQNGWSDRMKERLTDFLTKANLMCDGMAAVGYEYDSSFPKSDEKIHLVQMPPDGNHVDLVVIGPDLLDTALRVRVMWHCNNTFPAKMGIPTRKRLRNAVSEYNKTGTVETVMDDLTRIPAAGAELAIRLSAILQRGNVRLSQ